MSDFKIQFQKKLNALFKSASSQGIFSCAVAGFLFPDKTSFIYPWHVSENAVFDIASLTKVCPTSVLALKFILERKIFLDQKVIDFLPEIQTNFREEILVRHLLTHSLDYRVPMSSWKTLPGNKILENIFQYQFAKRPGTVFNYGNPSSLLLGLLLDRLTGKDLQTLGEEILWGPLQMTRTFYEPLRKIPKEEIVPTEFCPFRAKEIRGEVHDESAFVLRELFCAGSAGVFSSAGDLLRFSSMLLSDGELEGVRVIPKGVLSLISHNALLGKVLGACASLGFELNADRFMGTRHSDETFGKTGFTGASLVADSKRNAAVVFLSNFTWPKRENSPARINLFRSALADLFFDSLDEKF